MHEVEQKEVENPIIMDGNFNFFSLCYRTYRAKVSNDIENLINVINKFYQIDIYGPFQQTTAEYTFF